MYRCLTNSAPAVYLYYHFNAVFDVHYYNTKSNTNSNLYVPKINERLSNSGS